MYQSLHTSVIGPKANTSKCKSAPCKLNHTAEIGIAAHWRYKSNDKAPSELGQPKRFLNQFSDWQQEATDPVEFEEALKTELASPDEIFVFTPKGFLHQLPKGRHADRLRLCHPHRHWAALFNRQSKRPNRAAERDVEQRPKGGDRHDAAAKAQTHLAAQVKTRQGPPSHPPLAARGAIRPQRAPRQRRARQGTEALSGRPIHPTSMPWLRSLGSATPSISARLSATEDLSIGKVMGRIAPPEPKRRAIRPQDRRSNPASKACKT